MVGKILLSRCLKSQKNRMNKLKILLGGGLREIVHEKSFGGGGIFVYFFAKELAERGHEITILSLDKSSVPGCKVIPIATEEEVRKIELDYPMHDTYQLLESQLIALDEKKFDIVHINYFHFLFAGFSKFVTKPVIFTEHLHLLNSIIWQKIILKMVKPTDEFVFVAKHALEKANLINNKRFIYHGLDPSFFPFSENSEDYLFWLGRAKGKKGLLEAVKVAIQTQRHLTAAQAVIRTEDKKYLEKEINPLLTNQSIINFIGTQPYPEKVRFYQKAKAFLFPIVWEEPFGLVMLESMFCGTPIIAYARGSIPEVIKDGETGFIINSSPDDIRGDWIVKKTGIEGLCEAVERIYAMPEEQYRQMRKNCRTHVEKNFTVERMVNEYEKVYQQVIEARKNKL